MWYKKIFECSVKKTYLMVILNHDKIIILQNQNIYLSQTIDEHVK